jgi:hypothetical protein
MAGFVDAAINAAAKMLHKGPEEPGIHLAGGKAGVKN